MAAGLVLAAAVPGTLAASAPAMARPAAGGQPAAAALASHPAQPGYPVSVAITKMTPRWAGPGAVVTVGGTITNETKQTVSDLHVQLNYSSQRIAGLQYLLNDLATPAQVLAFQQVTGTVTRPTAELAPGASASWSVTFNSKQIGMTSFGVYPLTADVSALAGGVPSQVTANAFLPFVPAPKGKHAKSVRPPRQHIAWLWPVMDVPLVGVPLAVSPGQSPCAEPAAQALAASMAPGGRLNTLLAAGQAHSHADQLTWAVDPALLEDAGSLARCPGRTGHAAAAWLRQVQRATTGQQLFATPYANVNMTLIGQRHAEDVKKAFDLGRVVAGRVLGRSVDPAATAAGSAASTAWPSSYYSQSMLLNLALVDQVKTFVLPSEALGRTPAAFSTPVGAASVHVLAAASPLTQLLGTPSGGAASQFSTTNQFLAETALMAGLGRTNPIVVAPPQRPQDWHPTAGLANELLADTADAPWLAPASLSNLSAATGARVQRLPLTRAGRSGFYGRRELRALQRVDHDIHEVTQLQANQVLSDRQPSAQAEMALAALESADWSRRAQRGTLGRVGALADYLEDQRNDIVIVADSRVTLGGLKGNVPVVIGNRLGYPVEVQLQAIPVQPAGGAVTVRQHPVGLVRVPPYSQVSTTLNVHATTVGSTTITLRVLDRTGHPIPGATTVRMNVQATQFGTFAMIILAAALGIFVLASAVRGMRRGRPGSGGSPEPEAAESSHHSAGADTVVGESELRGSSPESAQPSEQLGAASPPR
jgi:hypothetical protein